MQEKVGGIALVAVSGSLRGQNFSIWNCNVDDRVLLRDIVKRWAYNHLVLERDAELPKDVRVTGGIGGPDLNLQHRMKKFLPLLPIQGARRSVNVIWPRQGDAKWTGSGGTRVASGLNKLRISTRYCGVDRNEAGFHKSSTFQSKNEAGEYQDTQGKYQQAAYIEAMRTPSNSRASSSTSGVPVEIVKRTLVVKNDDSSEKELFRATLKGPASLVQNWEATCDRFDGKDFDSKATPYPVFIPTYGRARKANLNWNAGHVYGPAREGSGSKEQLSPVVCIVVEPRQEEAYREMWPDALTLVLPENGRGPGYARWAIQRTCAKADVVLPVSTSRGDPPVKQRRLPFVWIADDGLSMFYRMVDLPQNSATAHSWGSSVSGCQRIKQREAPEGVPMFQEAMIAVQQHAQLPRVAVAGFLRDDGTAVCKKLEWKMDELSLYKIVLLNLKELRRLGVEYQQDLQMYEDICLNHEVMRAKGRTLKCQSYAFRASHVKAGGCANQRAAHGRTGHGTQMEDLISTAAYKRLSGARQQVIGELLKWVKSKEDLFGKKPDEEDKKARKAPDAHGQRKKRKVLSKEQGSSSSSSTRSSSSSSS